jgi:probable RNA-binding protein EIF1AD
MTRSKRQLIATAEETLTPPQTLEHDQSIARVVKGEGKNLYSVELPNAKQLLVELPARFRSTIWMKRGGFVLVDTSIFEDRGNKLSGQIINVIRDEKNWRKQAYW